MSNNTSLNEWLEKYDRGMFASRSRSINVLIDVGWHEWFCRNDSLCARLKAMVGMVKAVAKSPFIDASKVRVLFENNYSVYGPTYDSFSVVDIETDTVLYWITAKSSDSSEAEVHKGPDFKSNVLPEGVRNSNAVKKYFATSQSEKE